MEKFTTKDCGIWVDGGHASTDWASEQIIALMNRLLDRYGFSDKFQLETEEYGEFSYADEIADEAISFVNWEILGNSDFSENPHLQFVIMDNSLFLENTEEN